MTLALLTGAACAHHHPVPRSPVAPVPVGWEETGQASWYGHPYHGRETSSGQVYDMRQMTAAHRTLPFDTCVLVENRDNGRTVEVRINDRGPFAAGRILDLSYAAARVLGAAEAGVIPVRLRVIATPGRSQPRAFTIQVAGDRLNAATTFTLSRLTASTPVSNMVTRADGSVSVTVPAGVAPGNYQLVARNPDGSGAALDGVTVRGPPAQLLVAKGVDAGVRRAALGDRVLYRVRAGRFERRADAGRYARRLAALGYTVLVTPE